MKDMYFNNRNIVLICPKFYQYHDVIAEELIRMGATVYYFDERPSNSVLFKLALRLNVSFLTKRIISSYYECIDKELNNDSVTDVLILNAEAINEIVMILLKNKFPQALFTLYMWDSIKNKKSVPNIVCFFDRAYSFDQEDCKKVKKLVFEPLFYQRSFEFNNAKNSIDLSFVGSIHSDRLSIVGELNRKADIKAYFYMYSPSKLFTLLKWLSNPIRFFKALKLVKYEKIGTKKVSDIFSKSKCILDIHHPNQNGLTMRSFEALASGKKLVTTNKNILKYDFYHSDNVLVVDRKDINIKVLLDFIEKKYNEDKINEMKNYRIDKWLRRIMF